MKCPEKVVGLRRVREGRTASRMTYPRGKGNVHGGTMGARENLLPPVKFRHGRALLILRRARIVRCGPLEPRDVEEAEAVRKGVRRRVPAGAQVRARCRYWQRVCAADNEHVALADDVACVADARALGRIWHFEPAKRGQGQDVELVVRLCCVARPASPAAIDEAVIAGTTEQVRGTSSSRIRKRLVGLLHGAGRGGASKCGSVALTVIAAMQRPIHTPIRNAR